MAPYLFLLFTIVPTLELIFIIKVGAQIGAINTIVLLVMIGAAGAYMAQMQGFQVLNSIQRNLEKGILPTEDMLDGLLILCGGVLLLTPGFLTDVIGLLFLFPATRALLKILLKRKFQRMVQKGEILTFGPSGKSKKRGFEDYDDADFS